jgi:Ase1/PRC1/MAP65 family protein
VTPAVRPGSSLSKSAPNKRPRLGESTSKPAPLGTHRGLAVNGSSSRHKAASPSKGKVNSSSLPRPVAGIPKQGRALYNAPYGYQQQRVAGNSLAVSTSSSYQYGANAEINVAAKKASRARRESFKPRASVEENAYCSSWSGGGGGGVALGRWGFGGMAVKEEEEVY